MQRNDSVLMEAQAQLRGAHILLVEDNEINQYVAQEILTQAGILVWIANNGRESIELLRSGHFDGVLMDVQMPVMDGYTATRTIRTGLGMTELPIIAMTANAVNGDREQCLAAGMNDYVDKPINVDELFTTLAKWLRGPTTQAQSPQPQVTTDTAPIASDAALLIVPGIDVAAGLARVGGNLDLYRHLLSKFHDSQGHVVAALRLAQENNPELMIQLAHSLAGVAGNIGAQPVADLATDIERALKSQQSDQLDELVQRLDAELQPLLRAIADLEPSRTEDAQPGVATTPDLAALLHQFRALLSDANTRAIQCCASIRTQLRDAVPLALLEPIAAALDAYDFEQALARLPALEHALQLDG